MKNKSLLMLFIGIIALVLAACGGDDDASGEAEEVEVIGEEIEDATEITLWTFVGQHIDLYSDAAERWNEEHPDRPIQLVAETYPFEQMHNNLLLAIQSGQGGPDIADIEAGQFANYLQGEVALEPMNEYVEPVLDQSVETRFDLYAQDGNYYGIPTHVGATVMYYNTEIMDEAGVDIDSIVTWDDYIEAGMKVTENTDSMMWNVGTEDWLMDLWPMISQQESDAFDENGEVILDNEVNAETLQFLHDAVYEHEIAELTPGGMNQSEEFYGYMNDGGAASVLAPIWYMGRFIDSMPDLEGKMAIRPMPAWEEGGNRSAGMGGTGTVVTKESENGDLAKEFLAEAKISEEGNINLWKVLGFDPPRWDTWESDEIREDNIYYDYFSDNIFDILLEVREEINVLNITENTPDVIDEYHTNTTNDVLRNDSQSPEEALEQAADKIKEMQE
ncbi:arabinosaccharide transport system substrate-binding protein [Virgibacillus natechei]|uniref:Arabinosaccharide transport system substrate-binding protein n=1 Tax=Virgibacillus natechei TaxID=1216297 RepID=A0ABS4IEC1_9BACI|nr:ABC transporter substrate-binding protein [Virgibacillus natechei]MBP1969288.1 arabinosaccharide transport system substrate-binding protein [Virgibacillus natechei]UZD12443.1 ABC transporter substrate-binding protein [Virgibacillus natechei]